MSNVIVVDDQSSNRMVLSRLAATLEPAVQVKTFADPVAALSYMQGLTPDLLITDFQMPSIDGAELIRRFRGLSTCREVPAIVVTAHEDVRLRALALEAGANDFIISPLNHDEFLTQSRRLLDMRRSGKLAEAPGGISQGQCAGLDPSFGQIEMLNGLVENLAAKLLLKNGEIAHLTAEMTIVLEVTDTAAIFVDNDLFIRQFTRPASELYDLKARDLGRSLDDLDCRLEYDSLSVDFRQALSNGHPLERYLQSRTDRRHYRLRIIPIRNVGASAVGAMLIFTAIPVWHERLPQSRYTDPWQQLTVQ